MQAAVRVVAQPVTTPAEVEPLFATLQTSRLIVRRYRQEPSPLVRDSVRRWRTGRFDLVMSGNFDLIAAE
jgi:ATP-dependent Clp protease ATP-binding subunit ClpC